MARILRNRPELWTEQPHSFKNFLEAAADIFADSVTAIEQAYNEHRNMLDFLEERMGMKHLSTRGDILAYRDRELAQVADALEEAIRDKKHLASCLTRCLEADPE